jgi:predicted AAA+ superfamily ATPase
MLTGLRGSGKTTVMSQLYYNKRKLDVYRLYLSADHITQILGVGLNDVFSAYEDLIGVAMEQLDKPLFLFLDEIQYDEKWAIALKSLYDRSNKVFIFATGSSALALNTNPDIARRAVFEKLFPLSFTEYVKIKLDKDDSKGICHEVREAIFNSTSAQEVYETLRQLKTKMDQFWLGIGRQETDRYMKFGSLPFMVTLNNEALVYDQINKTLDRIINSDVARTGQFASEIISKIPSVLYATADMEQISYSKLASIFDISRPKIMEIFSALEKTETLIRVYPHGSHLNQVKKPSKYLFASPAFRSMYYNFIGNIISSENYMGKLLEDTVGMYLTRFLFKQINSSLTYDNAQGGADFIMGFGKEKIIIEVGMGDKNIKQVLQTAEKVKAKYGLVISRNNLKLHSEENIVQIPLDYFLLI